MYMPTDTRDRNQYFGQTEIHRYLKEYTGAVAYALNKIDDQAIETARQLLKQTASTGGRIFVGGNGGSAAISDHLCCDFVKGTMTANANALQTHSLVGSQALFSAIANDLGYDKTFSYQLEALKCDSKDTVILISSSGNSKNIIEAALFAQSRRASIIGMTGFDGGALLRLADAKLHVAFNNYGVIEDCHQALMHVLAQFHYLSSK
jgi:D-sedoheptulose 7-phosphate isomerase